MAEVKLFTIALSPYGQRVHLALQEKGIPFDLVFVDRSNKPKDLLEANPIHKKVPTIIHNGKPVAESLVILEYLEDAWPEQVPLLPKDAYEKSRIRFWTDYIYQSFGKVLIPLLRLKPEDPAKVTAIEAVHDILKTIEEAMNSFSAKGPFFTGATFGFLDVILAPLCSSALMLKQFGGVAIPGPEELPRLNKWFEAMKMHPSYKNTQLSPEALCELFTAVLKRQAAAV